MEHIVLDAGSTDGTLEYLSNFPDIRVVSEPDHGAHDAMNKGVRLAGGEIISFLNVDDLYGEGILQKVGQCFAEDAALDVAVGASVVFADDEAGGRYGIVARDHLNGAGFWFPELAFGNPGFNARFFRRRVFDRVGLFDNSYYIAADRHFLIRIMLAGLKTANIERVGIYYRLHSESQTMNPERRLTEEIAHEHARMAQEFLRIASIDSGRHSGLWGWHAVEIAKLTIRRLQAGQVAKAFVVLFNLTIRDPVWPVHLLRGLSQRRRARQIERRGPSVVQCVIPGSGVVIKLSGSDC